MKLEGDVFCGLEQCVGNLHTVISKTRSIIVEVLQFIAECNGIQFWYFTAFIKNFLSKNTLSGDIAI